MFGQSSLLERENSAHDYTLNNIPWTESPFFEEILATTNYPESVKEKIRFFAANGYLVVDPEIANFDAIAADIIGTLADEQAKHGSRVQDAWRYQPNIKMLASYPSILQWLRILFNREPIPFQTLNFCKGTQQATHSDLIHFSCVPQKFMAGVWFALEDVDRFNGALHYYPGSHKLPVYDLHDLGLSKSSFENRDAQYKKYERFVQALMEKSGLKKEVVEIKKGSYLIWSANLFHGGDPIVDKTRTRHTLVTHYYFDQCRYYNPLYSDVYLGDVAWKKIINIGTGKTVPHVYNGKEVKLPLKVKARYLVENMLRNNKAGRDLLVRIKKVLTKG